MSLKEQQKGEQAAGHQPNTLALVCVSLLASLEDFRYM